jgi:hypothetical protein
MADFSTGSGISGSGISASGDNDNLSLAFINLKGQTVAVGEAHDVELGFSALTIGTDSGSLELLSTGNMLFDASQYTFQTGAVNFDAAVTMDTTLGVDGVLTVNDTSEATSATTGSVIIDGGVGIAKDLYVGIDLHVAGDLIAVGDVAGATGTFGSLTVGGGYGSSGVSVSATGDIQANGDLDVDGAITGTGGANISGGETVLSSATVSDLTDNRVVLAGTAGVLEDSANLTYNGTVLTIGGQSQGTTALSVSGDAVVTGDLTVNGVTVTANAETVLFEDTILQLANNTTFNSNSLDVGWMYEYASGDFKGTIYDNNASEFAFFENGAEGSTGVITISTYADIRIKDLTAVGGTFSGNISAVDAIFTGNLQVDGNTTLGDADTDTLSINAKVDTAIIPSGSVSLGSATASEQWTSIFAVSGVLGNGTSASLTFNGASGNNTFQVPNNAQDALSIIDSGSTDIMVFDSVDEEIQIANYDVFITNGLDVDGTTNLDVVDIDGGLTADTATIEDLNVVNAVVFTDANGTLDNDATLTFDTSSATNELALTGSMTISVDLDVDGIANLDVVDIDGGANIASGAVIDTLQVSDLSDGRVVLAGTSGELEDSANLTFSGSALVVTGTAAITSTLDVGSTSTFADTITLDGGSTATQTINFATGGNGRLLAADELHLDGDIVEVAASAGKITLDSSTGVVEINGITITESAAQTHNDIFAQISLGSSNVAFLYEDYQREESETSDHLGADHDVFGVNELLGFKPISKPTIDLAEDRGQGHLYSVNTSVVENQLVFTNLANGDGFKIAFDDGGSSSTIQVDINNPASPSAPYYVWAAGGVAINVGADDNETVQRLANALQAADANNPFNGLQVVAEQNALKIVQEDAAKPFESPVLTSITDAAGSDLVINDFPANGAGTAAFVNGAINQPELYWEDIKITKWTGTTYTFGTDLQAAYDSASADQDVPSIIMDGQYDLSIELGDSSKFQLERSSKAVINRHTLTYEGEADPSLSNANVSEIQDSGLAFGHASMFCGEYDSTNADATTLPAGLAVVSKEQSVIQVVFDASTTGANLQTKIVALERVTTAPFTQGTGTSIDYQEGGASPRGWTISNPFDLKSSIEALANAINTSNGPQAGSASDRFFKASVIDMGTDGVMLQVIGINNPERAYIDMSGTTILASNLSLVQQRQVSALYKADSSESSDSIVGIVAKGASHGDMVQLHQPNTVFEISLASNVTGAVGREYPTIGEEMFVANEVGTGEKGVFIPAQHLGDATLGLDAGSQIFSVGYVAAAPEAIWDPSANSGAGGFVSAQVGWQIKYLPRFVAIKP